MAMTRQQRRCQSDWPLFSRTLSGRVSWTLVVCFVVGQCSCSKTEPQGNPTGAQQTSTTPTPTPAPASAANRARPRRPAPAPPKKELPEIIDLPDASGETDVVILLPDGERAVICGDDGKVQLYKIGSGETLKSIDGQAGPPRLAVSTNGELLAQSAQGSTKIGVWSLTSGEALANIESEEPIADLEFMSDNRRLAWIDLPRDDATPSHVRIWDVVANSDQQTLQSAGRMSALAVSPTENLLACAGSPPDLSSAGLAELWELDKSSVRTTWQSRFGACFQVAFAPKGGTLAIAEYGGTHPLQLSHQIRLVDVPSGAEKVLRAHMAEIQGLAFSPDGAFLLSTGLDNIVRVWQVATASLRAASGLPDYAGGSITCAGPHARISFSARNGQEHVHPVLRDLERIVEGDAAGIRAGMYVKDAPREVRALRFTDGGRLLGISSEAIGTMIYDTTSWDGVLVAGDRTLVADQFASNLQGLLDASRELQPGAAVAASLEDALQSSLLPLDAVATPDGRYIVTTERARANPQRLSNSIMTFRAAKGDQILAVANHLGSYASTISFSADSSRFAACSNFSFYHGGFNCKGPVTVYETKRPRDNKEVRWRRSKSVVNRTVPNEVVSILSTHASQFAHLEKKELLAEQLQAVAGDIPEIETSSDLSELRWQLLTLNAANTGLDVVRVKVPTGDPVDVVLHLKMTPALIDCDMLPPAGQSSLISQPLATWSDTEGLAGLDYTHILTRLYTGEAAVAGGDLLIAFSLFSNETVAPGAVAVNFVPRGSIARDGIVWPMIQPEFREFPALRQTHFFLHGDLLLGSVMSPTGESVASFGNDATVKIWNLDTRELMATCTGINGKFSADGTLLATITAVNQATEIVLWDARTGHEKRRLTGGHIQAITQFDFHPHAARLVTGGMDGIVALWDTDTGQQIPLTASSDQLDSR